MSNEHNHEARVSLAVPQDALQVIDAKIASVKAANIGRGGKVNSAASFALGLLEDVREAMVTRVKPPMSESLRADMICAVAALCTGTSSRNIAATAIEWTERYYGITTPAAQSQEPAVPLELCPTCGEDRPFSGTCGTSDSDTRALCKRKCKPSQEPMTLTEDEIDQLRAQLAKAVASKSELLRVLDMLLKYTKSCEGLLNCKPAGQIQIAESTIAKETGEANGNHKT